MKKYAIPLFAAAVALAVFFYWFVSSIDGIVKKQIETVGSELTGVPVSVESVNLDLSEGKGKISGLTIENPPGYATDTAFKLNELILNIDLISIPNSEPLILKQLLIDGLETNLEIKEATSNLTEISNAIRKNTKQAEDKTQSGQDGKPITITVQELVISRSTINVIDQEKSNSQSLPSISLRNVGGEQGTTPANLAGTVVTKLISEILKEAALDMIKEAVKEKVGEITKGLLDSINKALE